ncbi:MAG: DinB family protein [Longimicrobiales bacterium]
MPEAWLRGPIPGVSAPLMPVAHSLVDAGEEIGPAVAGLTRDQLWARPGGAASVGFHLRHIVGSLDRLLTYARGESLTEEQMDFLRAEGTPREASDGPGTEAERLVAAMHRAIEDALEVLRTTPIDQLDEPRGVGRAQLPSTVRGLLFHAAEHTRRHAGQIIATAGIVRGMGLGDG